MDFVRSSDRASSDVPHGVEAVGLQFGGVAPAHPPEVGEGAVGPQLLPVTHFVKFSDSHPIFIGGHMLGFDIHGNFGQVEIWSNPSRGSDAGGFQNVQDDGPGIFPSGHSEGLKVAGGVDKHLVNGIDMDVLRSSILEVHLVDPGAPFDIVSHPGRSYNVVQG